mmetsp:Transcript_32355/g.36822  ORF Transcript_32355/g.36822 Transcript_32355/m.36822 type:complete len:91 (+) Transcript_32355:427-699(+)
MRNTNLNDREQEHTKKNPSGSASKKEKTLVTVTAEELEWIFLFKQRPQNTDNHTRSSSTQDIVVAERKQWLTFNGILLQDDVSSRTKKRR